MSTIARSNNVVTLHSDNVGTFSTALSRDAERVVTHLLPNARKMGREMTVGNVQGEPGDSLSVCIMGEKAGVWSDFATGQGGDLIDLWREVRGLTMGEAIREVKDWLGIREESFPVISLSPAMAPSHPQEQAREKVPVIGYKRPAPHQGVDSLPVMAYLTGTRKLMAETLRAFGVESRQGIRFGDVQSDAYYLPSFRDGELIRWKLIALHRNEKGKKRMFTTPDAEPCLFGWQAFPQDARYVVIVEGELDALTGYQYGYPCLSVPSGGGAGRKQEWVEVERARLEQFETVFLCLDGDDAGREGTEEIARRLGPERCRVVSLPHKDLNDCLMAGVGKAEIDRCFQEAKPLTEAEEDAWPEPDMSIVESHRVPAPALPLSVFGSLAGWITQAAAAKSSPPDYVAAGLLGVTASLIGNARKVSPWQGWSEPSILWLALVGRPSLKKSPGLEPVMEPLKALEKELQFNYATEKQDYESQLEVAKAAKADWLVEVKEAMKTYPRTVESTIPPKPDAAIEPEAPTLTRLQVGDVTVEAMARILKQNPRGVLMGRDEMAGWLEGMGRYNSGGDRQFWLEAFGGRDYTLDRVKYQDDPLIIERLAVSTLGGITPSGLAGLLLKGADDGLASRFLYIWPDVITPERPHGGYDAALPNRLLRRLHSLHMDAGSDPQVMPLTPEAADLFEAFWKELFEQEEDAAGLLQGHIGKLSGLTLRLALILEMLWWAAGTESNPPARVSSDAVVSAYSLVNDYFLPMSRRAFGDAALPEVEKDATALARWILKERPETVNIRSLWLGRVAGLKTSEEAIKAVEELIDAEWLFLSPDSSGKSRGRKRKDYAVNPKVLKS